MKRKAKKLVDLADTASIPMMDAVLNENLSHYKLEYPTRDWYFFLTIAIVRAGIQQAPMRDIGYRKFSVFFNSSVEHLGRLDENAVAGFNDLHSYLESTSNGPKVFFGDIGNWVMMNLQHNHQLEPYEIEFGAQIGQACARATKDLW